MKPPKGSGSFCGEAVHLGTFGLVDVWLDHEEQRRPNLPYLVVGPGVFRWVTARRPNYDWEGMPPGVKEFICNHDSLYP